MLELLLNPAPVSWSSRWRPAERVNTPLDAESLGTYGCDAASGRGVLSLVELVHSWVGSHRWREPWPETGRRPCWSCC